MGKKFKRLHPDYQEVHKYVNLAVHVVLMDGTTFFGSLLSATPKQIGLRLTSLKKKAFSFSSIREIIIDLE